MTSHVFTEDQTTMEWYVDGIPVAELKRRYEAHDALVKALHPFAILAQLFDAENRGANMPKDDSDAIMQWPRLHNTYEFSVGDLRNARTILSAEEVRNG